MRQTVNNGYYFFYPDEVYFAFLPCIIKASGSNLSWIEVIIRCGNKERAYNVEAFGRKVGAFKVYINWATGMEIYTPSEHCFERINR